MLEPAVSATTPSCERFLFPLAAWVQVQAPPRYAALGLDNEHALQPLEAYAPGPPGSAGAQPFSVLVSPAASVVMDAHAHLSMHEVIGVLAGTFDEACRTIRCGAVLLYSAGARRLHGVVAGSSVTFAWIAAPEVWCWWDHRNVRTTVPTSATAPVCPPAVPPCRSVLRAHPVQELATEDNSINVEMDPEDEWRVRQQIEDDGMRWVPEALADKSRGRQQGCLAHVMPRVPCRVIGWYHSHPTFASQPSTIDIYNQVK